jgi:glycosyltransferase involved in cell wall biosynthesis
LSDEQISSDAEVDAAKRLARLFDADRASALAQFRETLARKGQAGKLLQQLNRIERRDVVVALAELVAFDAKTQEMLIVESARAFARSGERKRAEDLLTAASATRRGDYTFQFATGRVFVEMRLHEKALAAFEAAVAAKPTQMAAERAFTSLLALERYRDALSAMGRIIRTGTYREAMAKDFAFLLRHVKQGELDPDLAYALSELQGAEGLIVPALMPHLIALDLRDCVLAVVDRNLASLSGWDDATLAAVVPYLMKLERFDHLLRIREQGAAVTIPEAQAARFSLPEMSGFSVSEEYKQAAARFARTASAEDGLKLLSLLPMLIGKNDAVRFYAREKHRLARLVSRVAETRRDEAFAALAALVAHFAEPSVAQFFAASEGRDLASAITEAKRQKAAPDGTRLALLREDYFRFHYERRTGEDPDDLESEVRFADAAFDYFTWLAQWRPTVQIPVAHMLSERLLRPALALDQGRHLDAMSSWGLIQAKPQFSLAQPGQFDEFLWWYLNGLIGKREVAPDCFNPGLVAHLNETVFEDGRVGIGVSRFLKLMWARSPGYRGSFDLGNPLDRILLVLDIAATVLSRVTQFLPFLEPYLANPVLTRVLTALGGEALVDAVAGKTPPRPPARSGQVQDILLVGHGRRETGLGRNFGMLASGFASDGFAVTELNFDDGADAVSAEIARWHASRGSEPIVVLAVNAHDAPDIFMKDRAQILIDCYLVGFFLWEVSRVPSLQRLGVALMDEIWAPTQYVAGIYAPHRPTHVVGKGLFKGDEAFLTRPKTRSANAAFTFVTAFDFDSSVERKNPAAVVEAFQRAFTGGEKAGLIVKTSNVNAQHWSNAFGQWERLVAAAEGDRRIEIVTERYSNEAMEALVRDADCLVSLHRSEGFGYLIADAMAYGTPVIATDYSGNADFCTSETSYPVAYRLIALPEGAARWRSASGEWADPDIADAAAKMRAVFQNYDEALAKAALARARIKSRYGMDAFRTRLASRVRAIALSRASVRV